MKSRQYRPRDIESRWQERWRSTPVSNPLTAGQPAEASEPEKAEEASSEEPSEKPSRRALPGISSEEGAPSPATSDGPAVAAPVAESSTSNDQTQQNDREKKGRKARPKTHYVYPVPLSAGLGTSPSSSLRRMVAADVYGRLQQLMGAKVLLPVGLALWGRDLAREAVDDELMPEDYVEKRLASFKGLLNKLGVSTSDLGKVRDNDPSYYRWTQWLFLQLLRRQQLRFSDGSSRDAEKKQDKDAFSARREAERSENPSWEPAVAPLDFTVPGRYGPGWHVDVSSYGDRLLSDLGKSNWLLDDRNSQRGCIGRQRGCRVVLQVSNRYRLDCDELEVFTTRIEMIHGVTCVLVHPWHSIVERVVEPGYEDDIENYRNRVRQGIEPRISGVRTGGYAVNPVNLERIPVLVSRLAMEGERVPALLGVPAHDVLIFDLARRARLPIREVVRGEGSQYDVNGRLVAPFTGEGVLTNSGQFNQMPQKSARERIIQFFSRRSNCHRTTQFFLNKFPISESSAWGVPVPVIHCPSCGVRPVPENELPVLAPKFDVESLRTELEAEKDLSHCEGFSSVPCPTCGAAARRDPNVIADWLGRSWMFLRHLAPELVEEYVGEQPAATGAGDDGGRVASDAAISEEHDAPLAAESVEGSDAASADASVASSATDSGSGAPDRVPPGPTEEVRLDSKDSSSHSVSSTPLEDSDASSTESAASEEVSSEEVPPTEETSGDHGSADMCSSEGEVEDQSAGDKPEEESTEEESTEEESTEEESRRSDDESEPSRQKLFDVPSAYFPFRKPTIRRWLPVDTGVCPVGGGVSSILQTRFVTKFLYDLREISCYEPFYRFTRVGGVVSSEECAPSQNGSESPNQRHVSPERIGELVEKYGADSLRLYLLSQVPLSSTLRFNEHELWCIHKLLRRIWNEVHCRLDEGKFVSRRLLVAKHRLINELTRVMRRFRFLKAISAIYTFVNFLSEPETTKEEMDRASIQTFVVLLWPLVPHLASELWVAAGGEGDIANQSWPEASAELLKPTEVEVLAQVDNRAVARVTVAAGLSREDLEQQVLGDATVQSALAGRRVARVIAAPDRVVNILLQRDERTSQSDEDTSKSG